MLRIIGHIERLLLRNDCVIIPQWGGFVLREVPASCDEEGVWFYPARKEISFNTSLRHTDGLLAESYMQVYDVDYGNAAVMLEKDIEAMGDALREEGRLELGRVGSFHLGEEGQLVFTPGIPDLWNAAYYGLEPFSFPKLKPLVVEEVSPRPAPAKDVIYIPVNRRFLRIAAGAAAACALFFLLSTPVREVNTSAYTASFIPSEMWTSEASSQPVVSVEEEASTVVVQPSVEEEKPVEEPVEVKAPAPAVRQKMYHIVIASFPTERQADEFISTVDRQACPGVDKILRDGKCRVYAARFDNREEAERFQATLRENEKYKDAWLFISR